MAAARDHKLGRVRREQRAVFLIGAAVKHPVLRAENAHDAQAGGAEILGGVGREKQQPLKLARVSCGKASRHDPAERMPADGPAPDFREGRRDRCRRVSLEHGQVVRHVQQHTERPFGGKALHQRGVGRVFHLRAGVKDQSPLRALRGKDERVEIGTVCGGDRLRHAQHSLRLRSGAVIVPHIEPPAEEERRQKQQYGEQRAPAPRGVLCFCHVLFSPSPAIRAQSTLPSQGWSTTGSASSSARWASLSSFLSMMAS